MQIFLATPLDFSIEDFRGPLTRAMETGLVSALLVRRDALSEKDYETRVKFILPIAQSHDCAVLLDNLPALVKKLRADGVHMSSGQQKFALALSDLKPQFIVGAGDVSSRHEAMLRGEAGADYILFGDLDQGADQGVREMTLWWSELFETPCVLFDPATGLLELDPSGSEFIGLGDNIWKAPQGPAVALKALAARMVAP